MEFKTLLGLTSAIVGAGIVVGQDPSFEHPGLQPVINTGSSGTCTVEGQEKRVTVRFKQASATEILDWLSNQGVSFVTAGMDNGRKIDLNLTDIPLSQAIQVVGRILGGSFVKEGSTYVFQPGALAYAPAATLVQGTPLPEKARLELTEARKVAGQAIEARKLMELDRSKVSVALPGRLLEMRELELAQAPRMRMFQGEMPHFRFHELGEQDSKFWDSFRKDFQKHFGSDSPLFKELHSQGKMDPKKWEAFGHEMEKRFGEDSEFQKRVKVWSNQNAKEMEKRFGEGSEFQKRIKVWTDQNAKEMEKRFGPGSAHEKEMKAYSERHAKEIQKRFGPGSAFEKEMKAWGDDMKKSFGPDSEFSKKMKAYKLEDGKMRELSAKEHEQMMKELQGKLKTMPKMDKMPALPPMPKMPAMPRIKEVPGVPAIPRTDTRVLIPAVPGQPARIGFSGGDVSAIAKTLTPAQREKNKSQGFLYWSDLTKEQQAKLGAAAWTGNWSITYTKDGETFTVKSDPK